MNICCGGLYEYLLWRSVCIFVVAVCMYICCGCLHEYLAQMSIQMPDAVVSMDIWF